MSYFPNQLPYESAVALGIVSGAFAETRNGRNSDVDTASLYAAIKGLM